MLPFYSLEVAIAVSIIMVVVSRYKKSPVWVTRLFDLVSLGAGRMLNREYVMGVLALLFSVVFIHGLNYSLIRFVDATTDWTIVNTIGFFVFTIATTFDNLNYTPKEKKDIPRSNYDTVNRQSGRANDDGASAANRSAVAGAGAYDALSQVTLSRDSYPSSSHYSGRNYRSRSYYDDEEARKIQEHNERMERVRQERELLERKEVERDFEFHEDMDRFDRGTRITREMDELNRFVEESNNYTYDSHDSFNTYDNHGSYDSHDDSYNHHDSYDSYDSHNDIDNY